MEGLKSYNTVDTVNVKTCPHQVPQTDRDEQDKILGFLDTALRSEADFSIRDEYPSVYGDYPGGDSFFVESETGGVASHAATLLRQFQMGDYKFPVGLIGSVTTAQSQRGQGMAKEVLRSALRSLKRRGAAIAILWSDQPDFYRPLGFFRAGREVDMRFHPDEVPPVEDRFVDYDPEQHAHVLWRLYQKQESRVDRSLEEQKKLARVPRTRIVLVKDGEKFVAYLAINKGMDFENYIHEWAGDIEAIRDCVAWLQKHEYPNKPLTLIAPPHYDTDIVQEMASAVWEGVLGLVRILDRNRVLAAYRDFLKELGIRAFVNLEATEIQIGDEAFDITTDEQLIHTVFGEADKYHHPTIPFFLWGFDSI